MTLHVLGNSNDKHMNERIKLIIVNIELNFIRMCIFQPTYLKLHQRGFCNMLKTITYELFLDRTLFLKMIETRFAYD